jgi:bile acid-coenzyme A ligase
MAASRALVPIGRILTDLAAGAPDRPAVTCGRLTVTRGELESRANRLARAYESLGVGEGDFVTIALPNGAEFFTAAFAAWKLGATPQMVSHRLPDRERVAIIELAAPALVVGAEPGGAGAWPCVPAGFEPDPAFSDAPVTPDRVAPAWKAPTSGGSTGRPKLIVAGQPGEFDPMYGADYGMRPDGVQLVPGPLYHNAPFICSAFGLFLGQHLVVLPRFDAAEALRAIADYRVQWVNFVPTMMLRILRELERHPGRYDLSSLEVVWHMAAPCPQWLKQAWIDLVGADKVMELYGGTESQAGTVITGTEWLDHRGSVGRPAVGEIAVMDAQGRRLPAGQVGEVFMRPQDPRHPTYRYVGAEPRVVNGWESIGDLGWMDDDGYLYLSDRRTDLIISGGANIYPAEVEAALLEHPAVTDCVVVGLPDPDLGQRVHAVIGVSGPLSEAEVRTFLAERIARYKVPRSFRLTDGALRDDAGKVRRLALREREAELLTAGEAARVAPRLAGGQPGRGH